MKSVSIQELKQNLSVLLDEAAAGNPIQVTRHNRPLVILSPARKAGIRVGSRVGESITRGPYKNATNGEYLKILLEDREDRFDHKK